MWTFYQVERPAENLEDLYEFRGGYSSSVGRLAVVTYRGLCQEFIMAVVVFVLIHCLMHYCGGGGGESERRVGSEAAAAI